MRRKLSILLVIAVITAGLITAPAAAANPALVNTANDTPPTGSSVLSSSFSSSECSASGDIINAEITNNALYFNMTTAIQPLPNRGAYMLVIKDVAEKATKAKCTLTEQYAEESGDYSLSGTIDLSGLADATYKMVVRRLDGTTYTSSGLIFKNAEIVVSSGTAYFQTEGNIKSRNAASISTLKSYGTSSFIDTSLSDMQYSFADYSPSGTITAGPLTPSQQEYIRKKAVSITEGAATDYEKVKKIYEFVSSNVYYDKARPATNALTNPYINLKAIYEGTSNSYSIAAGKPATNCVGYASMVCAMTRSLGIPTAFIAGKHHDTETKIWALGEYSGHHWVMCYVDNRWITVDANAGTSNQLNKDTHEYEYYGLQNYTFFDCTEELLAQNYYITGFYKAPLTKLSAVTLSASAYTYSGAVKKPSVTAKAGTKTVPGAFLKIEYPSGMKNVGTYKVKVTGIAPYCNTVTASFKINPKATKLVSLSPGKKQIKVTWSKVTTEATGYEIKYSTSKSFSSAKTVKVTSNKTSYKTIKNLKSGKKYYFKIRTYKGNYYSSWSSIKYTKAK